MFRKRFNWNQNGSNSVQLWSDDGEGYIKVPQVRQIVSGNIKAIMSVVITQGEERVENVDFVEF